MKLFPTEHAPQQEVELMRHTSIALREQARRKQIVSAVLLVIVIFQFAQLPGALLMHTAMDIGTVVLLSQKRVANEVAPDALRIEQANVHGQRGDTMSAAELLLLVLVVASLVGVVLQYLLILTDRRRKRRRQQEMLVVATVTSVEEEIRRKVSRWYVTAVWLDTQTQHVYTFRSPPFALRPKLLVGDTLAVSFDPRQTNRYQMHL